VSDQPLPYGRQWIDDDDIEAVVEVLRSDWLTTGPAVTRFERALEAATGARHAVAVNSGSAALHSMYFGAGVGPGDEVITSPLTFAATANAALHLGARVKFADVSPDTGCLDPAAVAESIGERTRLVCAVDFAGHPADYDELGAVAGDAGATLVADAAHSLGATIGGRRAGALAHASAMSFHPVKPITTAEGGAVLTDDDELADRARMFRTHGITRDPGLVESDVGPWHYEQQHLGYNYRLSDVQAAIGIGQVRRLTAMVERRREIAEDYFAGLAGVDGLELPVVRPGVEHAWHLYVVRVPDPRRRRPFFERLHELGIRVQVHYIPVHHHPYYQHLGYERSICPVAEDFSARAVSLPLFPLMDDNDVARSIEAVRRAAAETL
jgi:perosamine synthetase